MFTTSWNAPKEAFTLRREFFKEHRVDERPLLGFQRMNAFVGMELLQSIHFHDIEKNANVENDLKMYQNHLKILFLD